jgi:ABC-type branched-subunit amino acid transport system ATPase component
MLRLDQVSRQFGGLAAVSNVSFEVEQGQIVGLIGPNGAGKTTLLNLISGLDQATGGMIRFKGQEIQKRPAHLISRMGIARTYQNIRLFAEMSVLENVVIGTHTRGRATLPEALFLLPRYRREERTLRELAAQLVARLGLDDVAVAAADTLSYGDQRRVELARALATDPSLLLLDEPTAGMNAAETERLGQLVLDLRAQGLTVLVVEHDMAFISQVCDRVVVLNFGQVIAHGTPEAIKADPLVIEAYLGRSDEGQNA